MYARAARNMRMHAPAAHGDAASAHAADNDEQYGHALTTDTRWCFAQVVSLRDDESALEQAFQLLRTDTDGYIGEQELRRIFCFSNECQIVGLDSEVFEMLISELGGEGEPGKRRVLFERLTSHPAFRPQAPDSPVPRRPAEDT